MYLLIPLYLVQVGCKPDHMIARGNNNDESQSDNRTTVNTQANTPRQTPSPSFSPPPANTEAAPDDDDEPLSSSPSGKFQCKAGDLAFEDLVKTSVVLLDNYWSQVFSQQRRQYRPVNKIYYYEEPITTSCGKAELQNAFYCRISHSIYYDENFLREMCHKNGDYAVVTVLAHEWAHLVQGNLGILERQSFTIQTELQADCMAGAFTKHLEQQGVLEEDDIHEGAEKLFEVGDPKGTSWFNQQAHGRPSERNYQFMHGYKNGLMVCF